MIVLFCEYAALFCFIGTIIAFGIVLWKLLRRVGILETRAERLERWAKQIEPPEL